MTDLDRLQSERRFALQFLGFLAIILGCVAALNLVVNPSAQFPTHFFSPVIQTSRAEKMDLLDALPAAPEGLILGSSRVMKVEPEYLEHRTGLRFFNAGVNYARPEDHLAILRYALHRFDQPPRMVILGIDPSSFADSDAPDPRLIVEPRLSRQIPEQITLATRVEIWKDLLSWGETKRSLKSLKVHVLDGGVPAPVEHYEADGRIVYDQREQQIADGRYDFASALQFNQSEYLAKYEGFQQISELRRQAFEDLVATCREHNIRLIVFLTPMHPDLENFLQTHVEVAAKQQQLLDYLNARAKADHFKLVDLSSLESFGGDPLCFVDGIHPLEPNTRLMVDQMLKNSLDQERAITRFDLPWLNQFTPSTPVRE